MRRSGFLLGLALALGTACASAASPGAATSRGDSKTVSEDELAGAVHLNLYDYVAAERPRWLRATPTAGRTLPVVVFMDDTRLGDVQLLRTLTSSTVRMLRYFEASAAQQKFNGRDLGPVIQVITK
jgi:hypothetical protein